MFELIYLMEFEKKLTITLAIDRILHIACRNNAFNVTLYYIENGRAQIKESDMDFDEMSQFIEREEIYRKIHNMYLEKIEREQTNEMVRQHYISCISEDTPESIKKIIEEILKYLCTENIFYINEDTYLKIVHGFDGKTITFQSFVRVNNDFILQTSSPQWFVKSLINVIENNPEFYENYILLKNAEIGDESILSDFSCEGRN